MSSQSLMIGTNREREGSTLITIARCSYIKKSLVDKRQGVTYGYR